MPVLTVASDKAMSSDIGLRQHINNVGTLTRGAGAHERVALTDAARLRDILEGEPDPQGAATRLIHEALLSERGWKLTYDRLSEMTPTRFSDLRRGLPHQF